jgi:predicted transcriptional regulator
MKVKQCMVPADKLFYGSDLTTIKEAGAKLPDNQIGSLIILSSTKEKKTLIGIITKSDIIEGYLYYTPDSSVTKIMTQKYVYCFENDSIEKICESMINNGVHHCMVLNENKNLGGFISSLDILKNFEHSKVKFHALLEIPKKVTKKIEKEWKEVVTDIKHNIFVHPEKEGYEHLTNEK